MVSPNMLTSLFFVVCLVSLCRAYPHQPQFEAKTFEDADYYNWRKLVSSFEERSKRYEQEAKVGNTRRDGLARSNYAHEGDRYASEGDRYARDGDRYVHNTYDYSKYANQQKVVKTNENSYECTSGRYRCAGTGMCIELRQVCDAVRDCPHGDDEKVNVCHGQHTSGGTKPRQRFRGQGFMFQVNNLHVRGNSTVQMFDQNSDNVGL